MPTLHYVASAWPVRRFHITEKNAYGYVEVRAVCGRTVPVATVVSGDLGDDERVCRFCLSAKKKQAR